MIVPIDDFRESVIETVRANQVTVVIGETGSGKTTRIPQFLYREGFAKKGLIGVTEPRRIAAVSTAEFVAQQIGIDLGDEVGYQVRFDDFSSAGTDIKFMTDGILLREFQLDPDLKKYSTIMIDEAHERSVNIDFVLGLLKDLLARRSDLRVVVASATIDEEKFSKYFWNAPIIKVSGRMFPVETFWSDRDIPYSQMPDAVVEKIAEIHESGKPGDVLAFMTGQDDIHKVAEGIFNLDLPNVVVIPVYAGLPSLDQKKIFANYPGMRKVVVATNIAETSITVDGVVYVVDGGYIKQSNFHPESGIQSLDVVLHSQAGCNQREGRAGRTQEGICYRMYTKENFESRPKFTEPEIRRTGIASVVLTMESIGISNIRGFDFVDAPEKEAFTEAYETLIALGAIEKNKKGLTEIGNAMARLPLEPKIARMLLEADKYGCVKNVATIAAFLSVRNIFSRPKDKEGDADAAHYKFKHSHPSIVSDALTFLKVWRDYKDSGFSTGWCFENFLNHKSLREVSSIRDQLFRILEKSSIELSESEHGDLIAKAVAVGLAYNLFEHSYRHFYSGVLRPIGSPSVSVHPSSTLFGSGTARWMVVTEIVKTTKNWARGCTDVKPEWLPDIVPSLCKFGEPTIDSYNFGEEQAIVKKPIIFKGMSVGDLRSKVSASEAKEIQNARIKDAEANGLVLLTFLPRPGVYDFITNWFAEYKGQEYKNLSSSSDMKQGETYYCKLEDSFGRKYAITVFRVFHFEKENKENKKENPPQALVLDKLAEKWGARLK